MNSKNNAIAYIKSASLKPASRSMQLLAIKGYADRHEMKIQRNFVHVGPKPEATLQKMLGYCKSSKVIKYLLITEPYRLSRNYTEYLHWKDAFSKLGVEVVSTKIVGANTDSPMRIFIENLYAMIGQIDSTNRSEIVRHSMKRRAELGYSVQRPPLGYARSFEKGIYCPDKVGEQIGKYVKEAINGTLPLEQLRSKISGFYHPENLLSNLRFKSVILNPYYAGYVTSDGKLFKGKHKPIVSEGDLSKLKSLLG